jgi:hypothetical protein
MSMRERSCDHAHRLVARLPSAPRIRHLRAKLPAARRQCASALFVEMRFRFESAHVDFFKLQDRNTG